MVLFCCHDPLPRSRAFKHEHVMSCAEMEESGRGKHHEDNALASPLLDSIQHGIG